MRFTKATLALLPVAVMGLSGCLADTRYFGPGEQSEGVWAFALDSTTPAYIESEDGSIYIIEQRVVFDFREPTDDELADMADVGSLQVPYASLPFVRRHDIEIQVDFTLSNLGDSGASVAVTLNGINEFNEYAPGAQIIDEELVADFSGWERAYDIGPGERIQGTIREDEIDEIAVDLATVVNGAPNPNQIVYFENQSSLDARSLMYMPDLIPALTGVKIGLRAEGNDVPIMIEASVRIRDLRHVLVQGADEPWELPTPTVVSPMTLAPPAMP
ncbi:MAG: hypothetical protein AB7S26_05440 [Sandaracinaceae bacterium]